MKVLESKAYIFRDYAKGTHWVFLCYTKERFDRLCKVVAEQVLARDESVPVESGQLPAGFLGAQDPGVLVAVPKSAWGQDDLHAALREHFGYEQPDPRSDLFTLGIAAEDDEKLTQREQKFYEKNN